MVTRALSNYFLVDFNMKNPVNEESIELLTKAYTRNPDTVFTYNMYSLLFLFTINPLRRPIKIVTVERIGDKEKINRRNLGKSDYTFALDYFFSTQHNLEFHSSVKGLTPEILKSYCDIIHSEFCKYLMSAVSVLSEKNIRYMKM